MTEVDDEDIPPLFARDLKLLGLFGVRGSSR